MIAIHVYVHVKPESIEAFRTATIENVRQSRLEPGVARFDVFQQQDAPERFELIEVYRAAEATAAHKETRHYQVWRDTVADMMAEPRRSVKFTPVFPPDTDW
jgi:quinol monooxygenase YgiN